VEILKGRIVSLISAKGGAGATFISSNLSVLLAATGKTVLLDLEENSSSLLLNLEFDKAAAKLLSANLNPGTFASLLPVHFSGLYCAVLDVKEKESLKILADTLCAGFQNIVFDAGTLLENSEYLLENSSALLLTVNPDIVSLRAAEKTVSKLTALHIDLKKMAVVLNKTWIEAGINEAAVEKMLGLKVLCSVPFDSAALNSINTGRPLILSEPSSKVVLPLKTLVAFVQGLKGLLEEKPKSRGKDEDAKIKEKVHARLLEILPGMHIELDSFNDLRKKAGLQNKVKKVLEDIFAAELPDIKVKEQREHLMKLIMQEALGLGPLEDLLDDPGITEIMVNGKDHIYIERNGKIILTDRKFLSEKQLLDCIERIVAPVGRRINESVPVVDARLLDGSRVNAIIPPLSLKGPVLTIRKFSKERLTIADLIKSGTLTKEAADFIRVCVLSRRNIAISGGTGCGKTTLLNIIASFIPADERIVTIEDSAELNLPQEHVVTLETRPPNIEGSGAVTIRDLVKNALRMRPDRIVIGECRGGEALDMLQAMNTGHDGSITTLHSNSPRDTLSRLETMALMSGMELPILALRGQIASALDIIIHQERLSDGTRKITNITEVAGLEGGIIATQELFVYKHTQMAAGGEKNGGLQPKGIMPGFLEELYLVDKAFDRSIFLEKP